MPAHQVEYLLVTKLEVIPVWKYILAFLGSSIYQLRHSHRYTNIYMIFLNTVIVFYNSTSTISTHLFVSYSRYSILISIFHFCSISFWSKGNILITANSLLAKSRFEKINHVLYFVCMYLPEQLPARTWRESCHEKLPWMFSSTVCFQEERIFSHCRWISNKRRVPCFPWSQVGCGRCSCFCIASTTSFAFVTAKGIWIIVMN